MENEIWKEIPGYAGKYEVSNFGRVKSLARKVLSRNGGLKPIPERILKQCVINDYCNVILCADGKTHKQRRQEDFLPWDLLIAHKQGIA